MGTEEHTASTGLQDVLSRLDVDAVGMVRLADCKGTRLEETAMGLLPEVRSVVILAMEISREVLDLAVIGREAGAPSLNDLVARDADYLYGRLTKACYDVAKASRRQGFRALPLPAAGCPADTRFLEAVFSYKHAAQAAGLGRIGKHSLLVTRDFGPRVRLSCCLTEAALEPTGRDSDAVCGACRICIEKCPAGALAEPEGEEAYGINKYACSSFYNGSGGACIECMRLCPAGIPEKSSKRV